jgi:acyl-CoA synthetase (AMP-forming)/AMP-acid ligase II/1-acyl-sn-glycerol-3-phosphate acyltransferase/acyl carrier protein
MLNAIIVAIVRALLSLRYRIEVQGLEAIAARGREKILFLPSHPSLLDPVMVVAVLAPVFAPHSVADQDGGVNDTAVFAWLGRRFGVRTMPLMIKHGPQARTAIERVMAETMAGMRAGENVVLYAAGHLLRSNREELAGNSAVQSILHEVPGVRVVLCRTRGIWGSCFSAAGGDAALDLARELKSHIPYILKNFIFFTPRRRVTMEFVEPEDLPRDSDRNTLNRYLEAFYNQEPLPRNTWVPYSRWDRGGARELPEPAARQAEGNAAGVPEGTRQIVLRYLQQLSGVASIGDTDRLAVELGLDSLLIVEIMVWLQTEFGASPANVESLRTVADVLLAASGESLSGGHIDLQAVPPTWFSTTAEGARISLPAGETIPEVFLRQAARYPDRVVIADQLSGVKTYRDLVLSCLALTPQIARLSGERVGIMLPASVAATVVYLSTLFAGKTPVMINWTVGRRNMLHALDLSQTQVVLTSQRLTDRLLAQGTDLGEARERLVYLEQLGAAITRRAKLRAFVQSKLSWGALRNAAVSPTAAILFTSGSESLPKAVPLSHLNVLTNLRDILQMTPLSENDRLLGMLPPFHSFGLTGNLLLSVCGGLPTVFHANPTEGAMLARLVEAYRVSMMVGTPTFLSGAARAGSPEQLASVRLAFSGAEDCPARVYALLQERCPRAVVVEGYGITECSPIVAADDPGDPHPFTIGRPLPSVQTALVDVETGGSVAPGAPGLLLVRGPSIFSGYLGDAPDPFVRHDGQDWYRTGDLVSADADGVLTFRGRLKRFVKIGGEMISLPAIESTLLEAMSLGTEDGPVLAVLATSDADRPELVLYVTRPASREEVNRLIGAAGLSPLHFVRQVIPVEAIPVLGTGKTDYRALQERLAGAGGKSG